MQGLRTLGKTQQLHWLLGFPSVGHPSSLELPPYPPVACESLHISNWPFKEKQKGFISKGSSLSLAGKEQSRHLAQAGETRAITV